MTSEAMGKPDVPAREIAIINYLRSRPGGAILSDIYEHVSQKLGDTISRPAYYKLINRLIAAGKVEQIEGAEPASYKLPTQLHSSNRLTLDDVYEMLPFLASTETMARAIEAQQYFLQHRDTIIRKTAQALTQEPAVQLFHLWIIDLIKLLEADLRSYTQVEKEGPNKGQAVLADTALEYRTKSQCDNLRNLLYRYLSVPHKVIDLPEWEGPSGFKHQIFELISNQDEQQNFIKYEETALLEAIKNRVFGVGEGKTAIGLVTLPAETLDAATLEMIISGSDGSFYSGTLGIRTAQGFIEDESFILTFNNGVAYVRSSERLEALRGSKKFVHSAPVTRQTLDDPTYKGMVMAPFMFPTLTPSEYEHMARAATDVVQMRVDDDVFNGRARDLATGEQIMTPRVHIRDGTITPQERYFNHYYRMDPYGEIVREGINHTHNILQRINTARGKPPLYAGAVKSTQIRLFSKLVSWYISRGSKITLGEAIEPNWDSARADFISDIDVMTILLSCLPPAPDKNGFWVSCVTIRQFASLTDFYDTDMTSDTRPYRDWFDMLLTFRNRVLEHPKEYRGTLPYHALISEDDLANDPYLYLLEHADYASFYIGHSGGEPAAKIPRYEFLCSLRKSSLLDTEVHIQDRVEQLVTALLTCKFHQDRDHNYMSKLTLVKIVPFVVYRAHEFAKEIGRKLESEFKSAVVKRLSERRKQKIEDRDTVIAPVSVQRYLQKFNDARQALPEPEPPDEDR